MAEKYINLEQRIIDANGGAADFACSCYNLGVEATLEYLDRNPDQVPGRTITESEFRAVYEVHGAALPSNHYQWFLGHLGITVTPDPEPTNAEKLATILARNGFLPADVDEISALLDSAGVEAPDHG